MDSIKRFFNLFHMDPYFLPDYSDEFIKKSYELMNLWTMICESYVCLKKMIVYELKILSR